MKKFACLVFALALGLSTIGCGGETKKAPTKEQPPAGGAEKPAEGAAK